MAVVARRILGGGLEEGRCFHRLCPPVIALVQVPTELREFRTLLHTLGVPERFRPGDYLGVLKDMEVQAKGRPLDSHALGIAVGECLGIVKRIVAWAWHRIPSPTRRTKGTSVTGQRKYTGKLNIGGFRVEWRRRECSSEACLAKY